MKSFKPFRSKLGMRVFEPFKLGSLTLKNRIVMASMGTNLADPRGFVTDALISYYAERARGGVGLIMTELATVDFPFGNAIHRQLSLDGDQYISGLRKLARGVQKHGAKIFIQLNHAGNRSNPQITGAPFPVSASNVPNSRVNVEPRPLTLEEITRLVESFGQAARRARDAGFNGIDLHFAHGYLLCQFLSSYTNRRIDGYGGTFDHRCRFPLEVLQRCRSEVGQDFIISCKVTGHQYMDKGITLTETKRFCRLLDEHGIDAIQVSGGDSESAYHFPVSPMYHPRGCYIKLAESVKKVVNIPVIAVGRINNLDLANRVVEGGKADLVAMGRAFLADPQFPRKGMEGRTEDIRLCIGCNQGCIGRDRTRYLVVGCALNPEVGRERDGSEIRRTKAVKKILVVGGGPAGMEAARASALRGNEVTLVEGQNRLGGQLRLAATPPGRKPFLNLIRWYRIQLKKAGVRVLLGREVTPGLILDLSPAWVILATGGIPLVPDIEGVKPPGLVHASEVLSGRVQPGKKVVIIGGGSVGLETADFIASQKKRVTVIEQLSEFGRDMELYTKRVLLGRLAKKGVTLVGHATVRKAERGVLSVEIDGSIQRFGFDGPLIYATGYRPHQPTSLWLKEMAERIKIGICEIGDCVSPRQLRDAIHEGYRVSENIEEWVK